MPRAQYLEIRRLNSPEHSYLHGCGSHDSTTRYLIITHIRSTLLTKPPYTPPDSVHMPTLAQKALLLQYEIDRDTKYVPS